MPFSKDKILQALTTKASGELYQASTILFLNENSVPQIKSTELFCNPLSIYVKTPCVSLRSYKPCAILAT